MLAFRLVLSKKVSYRPVISSASYHQSAILAAGRWGGDKALETGPRELSRKQKKRKKTASILKSGKVDKAKSKLKDNFVKSQIESPQFNELLTEKNPDLNAAIRRMMLPDDVSVPTIDSATRPNEPLHALGVLSEISSGLEREAPAALGRGGGESALSLHVSKKDANNALKTLASLRDVENTERMLGLMVQGNIEFQHSSLIDVLKMYNKLQSYDQCIAMFDNLDTYSMPHPNPFAWACLIQAKTQNGFGNVDEGLKLIKHLERSGVVLVADMFNPVLRGLVKNGRHEEAFDVWAGMKVKGINPNVESYNIMVEQCQFRGQPERAFFLVDEMKLADLLPDKTTYCKLIRACATAPVWVNGYQDIVFDALAKMEGQELMPDVEVYNSLLYAFSAIGDGAAADFYLQEMKRKNLNPDVKSYNHVLSGYASNQMVGAKYYGKFGRYVRPAPPPDSERQALYKEAGFDTVNEELSKTFIKEDPPDRGKRPKMQYEDIAEFDEEMQESFDDNLRLEIEGKKMRQNEVLKERVLALEQAGSRERAALPTPKSYHTALGASPDMGGEPGLLSSGLLDESDSASSGMGDDALGDIFGGDKGLEEMFNNMKGGKVSGGDENLDQLMKQLNSDNSEEMDPSIYLNEEDRKEWESFLGEMGGAENLDGAAGEVALEKKLAALSGDDENNEASESDESEEKDLFDDEMMQKLNKMLATMEPEEEGEKVPFTTSQSGTEGTQSTVDAFKTLNTLLGHLDDSSGGVSMKEHYVSNNKSIAGGELELDEEGLVSTHEIDKLWDLVEFGRAPNPDYSDNLRMRRSKNIDRALEIYKEMCDREDVSPDAGTLAAIVGVIGNATLHRKAEEMVEKFRTEHYISPDRHVYNAIIKMHIVRHDINSAMENKERMRELGMHPSREVYGILIQSLTARKMLEESLLTLEEATDAGMTIREVHLRRLRHMCNKLGVVHPNLPENPMAWMNAVRDARKHRKIRSQKRVQPIQSAMFNN